ncbi:uncharacterized protein LOC143244850 [Tachypleus tridentatus]|uniref:uncharacterized protein LOC143244850 n=1 Tax=Tachypleus tridentatus TaxID=6853 RepID=UPI003FD17C2A
MNGNSDENILFTSQELNQRVATASLCNTEVKASGNNFCDTAFSHPHFISRTSHNSAELQVSPPKEILNLDASPCSHTVSMHNNTDTSSNCSDVIMNYGMASRPEALAVQSGFSSPSLSQKPVNEEVIVTSQISSHTENMLVERVSNHSGITPNRIPSQNILTNRGSPQPLPSLREMLNVSPNMDDEMHHQFLRQAAKVVEQITRVSSSRSGQNVMDSCRTLAPSVYWKHFLGTSYAGKKTASEICLTNNNENKQEFPSVNNVTKTKDLEKPESKVEQEPLKDEINGQSEPIKQNVPFAINMSNNQESNLKSIQQNTCTLSSLTTNNALVSKSPVQSTTIMARAGIKPELYTEERHLLVQSGVKAESKRITIQGVPCHRCCKTFSDSRSLQRHLLVHRGFRPYRCNYCPKAFMLNGDLKRHLRIHNGERPFACEVCGRRFTLKGNLMQHFRTHTPEKQFTCTICRKNYAQKDSLYRHIRAHFGEKPYECTTCGKRFSLKGDLSRHILIHSGLKPHSCRVCGRKFSLKGNLTQHIRTHSREKPPGRITNKEMGVVESLHTFQGLSNVCGTAYNEMQQHTGYSYASSSISTQSSTVQSKQICIQSSSRSTTENSLNGTLAVNLSTPPSTSKTQTSSNVTQHSPVESPQGGLSFCSECSKTFSTAAKLHEHVQMIHEQSMTSGFNSQDCNYCEKSFSNKSELCQHISTHCAVRPYECHICSKTFTLKGNLHQHLTTHQLGKSFFCPMCDKPFGNQRNLKLHVKRHETARANFACTNCGRAFLAKSDHFFHYCKMEERYETKVVNSVQAESSSSKHVISSSSLSTGTNRTLSLPAFPSSSSLPESNSVPTYTNTLKNNNQISEIAKSEVIESSHCTISTCTSLQSGVATTPISTPSNGSQSFLGPIYRHLYFNNTYQDSHEKDDLSMVVQASVQDPNVYLGKEHSRLLLSTSKE